MSDDKKQVLVLGAGGFGCNIMSGLAKMLAETGVTVDLHAVDSSKSNMRKEVEGVTFQAVPDTDGNGKYKDANLPAFRQFVPGAFSKLPQAQMAICCYGLSGGTGSVLGPLFVNEFMARGIPVISVTLATSESLKTTENTRGTLQTLSNISRKHQKPVHIVIEENGGELRPSEIDEAVKSVILDLMRITGGSHTGLDTEDVKMWLDHSRAGLAPSLTLIERFDDMEVMKQVEGAINRLSLVHSLDTEIPDLGTLSNCEGILINQEEIETHFITTTVGFDRFRKQIDERVNALKERHRGLNTADAFGDSTVDDEDDFMVC